MCVYTYTHTHRMYMFRQTDRVCTMAEVEVKAHP